MPGQSQLRTPRATPSPARGPAAGPSPAGPGRGGRGNAFAQDQLGAGPETGSPGVGTGPGRPASTGAGEPPAAPEQQDPIQAARAAYADRLWEVSSDITAIVDPAEQQRAARAVLGQAVEVQAELEMGHTVEVRLLPRIPDGNEGGFPFRPFPPDWIRPARMLLSLAGGTGAAAPSLDSGFGGIWDPTSRRSASANGGVLDKLSRIGREGADYGIYGYQTQSNNLASPEATCNVTSMAMVVERLGFSRDDLVRAIELELKKRQETARLRKEGVPEGEIPARVAKVDFDCVMLAGDAWKTRVLQYLRAENGERRAAGYQKPRGAAQTDRQLQDWAGQFQENAGMDDLVHFVLDLLGLERTAINAGDNPRKVLGFVSKASRNRATPTSERIDAGGANTWARTRTRVEECLAGGGAAMISIRHKGRGQSGTHICAIQNVEADGILVDDPFGKIRPDYDANKAGDAYSTNRGGARDRDRKNRMDRSNPNDWHMSATVGEDEVKGESTRWSDSTVSSAWQYVVLFQRGTPPTATGATTATTGTAATPAAQ